MECTLVRVVCVLLLLRRGLGNHCDASVREDPVQLVETVGSTAVFSCTVLGAIIPTSNRGSPCNYLFNEGNLNPVQLYWEVDGIGMYLSTSDLPTSLQDRGVTIATSCPRQIDLDSYRRLSQGRLASEPSNFCLSELSCNGTISVPVDRDANGTVVRCGTYSTQCEDNVSNLGSSNFYLSTAGRLQVRDSLLSVQVSQDVGTPGTICVQCIFTEDTPAIGCQISIEGYSLNGGIVALFNASTKGRSRAMQCHGGISNGTYRVTAVEIDADGALGTRQITQSLVVITIDDNTRVVNNEDGAIVGLSLAGVVILLALLGVILTCLLLVKRKHKKPRVARGQGSSPSEGSYVNRSIFADQSLDIITASPYSAHEYDYPSSSLSQEDYSYEESQGRPTSSAGLSYLYVLPDSFSTPQSCSQHSEEETIVTVRCVAYDASMDTSST